jgi:hypothetical protein
MHVAGRGEPVVVTVPPRTPSAVDPAALNSALRAA